MMTRKDKGFWRRQTMWEKVRKLTSSLLIVTV